MSAGWLALAVDIRPHQPISQLRRDGEVEPREVRLSAGFRGERGSEEEEGEGALLALHARLASGVVVVVRAEALGGLVAQQLERLDVS
eukprot:CAMPEP_0195595082 /NCGR_PEP_ID=MMETSP0815-20121206/1752_1 /TAXON_ID=97485 /ORGANISM="Prymnesium parvum, Strain Texoma1" /LENGTH=87 /DNA_ID=CAMNT_0040734313 /DNA_START=360 /DNA_END=624 /DNA_ORIENTATION=-